MRNMFSINLTKVAVRVLKLVFCPQSLRSYEQDVYRPHTDLNEREGPGPYRSWFQARFPYLKRVIFS